jgi:hypothetical protein
MLPQFRDTRFLLSGQTNFIFQAHPGFHVNSAQMAAQEKYLDAIKMTSATG